MELEDKAGSGRTGHLAQKTVELLIQKKWHISFAESCTGGLAASKLTEIPNASMVFDASVVTYANAAKVRYAGVNPDTLKEHGAVSEEVAAEMAAGIAKNNQSEVGIGISGVAGPGGGTKQKPVGMVCFGFWMNGTLFTDTVRFGDIGRNPVREKSVAFVYRTLEDMLMK